MVSSSGTIPYGNDLVSDMEENVQEVISNRDILECKDVPRHLWTTKCVSLYNSDGTALEKGICHSVKSDLVVGSTRPLGDTHVVVQISRSLKRMSSQTSGGTLFGLGQSPISFIMMSASSTMRGITCLIVVRT